MAAIACYMPACRATRVDPVLARCGRSRVRLKADATAGVKYTAGVNRARDWFAQAEKDLAHAQLARGSGSHEWACFASQQAAEKAVKSLHLHLGQEAWGHVIARLLAELPESAAAADFIERGRVLDNFYVATRYANGHPEGAPFEHYGPLQSEQAIAYAGEIVAFVRARLA